MKYTTVRWQQRFQHFEKSLALMRRIAELRERSEGERMGLIQSFEMCFELAWKTTKDYLDAKGYAVKAPREVLRQAVQDGIIVDDGRVFMEALDSRNEIAHIYDESSAKALEKRIITEYAPAFLELHGFFKQHYAE